MFTAGTTLYSRVLKTGRNVDLYCTAGGFRAEQLSSWLQWAYLSCWPNVRRREKTPSFFIDVDINCLNTTQTTFSHMGVTFSYIKETGNYSLT